MRFNANILNIALMGEFMIIAFILFIAFLLIVKQLDDLDSFEEDIINSKKSCCNCHGGCSKSIINSELEYCQDDE